MKRDRIAEAERLLGEAETSLRAMLLESLPRVAETGASLLANSDYLPVGFPRSRVSAQGELFYQHSRTCLGMREALNLPTEGTVGALFIAACAQNASEDGNRLGPRRLAMSLAERLANET
jgi:hypothetical protein